MGTGDKAATRLQAAMDILEVPVFNIQEQQILACGPRLLYEMGGGYSSERFLCKRSGRVRTRARDAVLFTFFSRLSSLTW